MRTTRVLTVSMPPKLAKAVKREVKQTGSPQSEFFRIAVRRYINDLADEKMLQQLMKRRAREIGLKTEDDVARLVEKFRDESL